MFFNFYVYIIGLENVNQDAVKRYVIEYVDLSFLEFLEVIVFEDDFCGFCFQG